MKELIRNWLALPDLLWKSFVFLLDFFWRDRKLKSLPKAVFELFDYTFRSIWSKRGRSTVHNCSGCKYFIKQPLISINWNKTLKTNNVLLEGLPTQVDASSCLLNHTVTLNSACSRWNDGSPLSSTEEERILSHNW